MCLVAVAVVAAVMIIAPAASAGSVWSAYKNIGTIGDVNYQVRSAVTDFDDGSGVTARTTAYADDYLISIQLRVTTYLLNGQGVCMAAAGPVWNVAGTMTASAVTDKLDNHGYYKGSGIMQARRSDGAMSQWYDSYEAGPIHHTD